MTPSAKVPLMIVDDDPHIRYLMEAAAARTGEFGPVISAPDGDVALQLLAQRRPDELPALIVSDLSMPRMNGVDLLRILKQDPRTRSIPVAIITSSNIPNDRADALAAGACHFLEKPHGLETLTTMLRTLRASCCDAVAATPH